MKKDLIIEKQKEIIKDAFYQTGYSNGKLRAELQALESETEPAKELLKREELIKLINDFINTPMGTNVGVFVDEFLASHPEPQHSAR